MAAKSTVNLDYPPGATPLDADELASLIPGHLSTQAELNEWEQLNIGEGDKWARKQRKDSRASVGVAAARWKAT